MKGRRVSSCSSLFAQAKNTFLDAAESRDFVLLDGNIKARMRLLEQIHTQPFSILLLTGLPGVGKTYLAQEITQELSGSVPIYLQQYPFVSIIPFLQELHGIFLPGVALPTEQTRENLLESFRTNLHRPPVIILDEIQLYAPQELEGVRMLSDTKLFRFILILHRVKKSDLLAETYFTSRIWSKIELPGLSRKEVALFVEKKLSRAGALGIKEHLNDSSFALLHDLSQGNLRLLGKICFKLFEICEAYEARKPSLLAQKRIPKQWIEMAALDLGVIA